MSVCVQEEDQLKLVDERRRFAEARQHLDDSERRRARQDQDGGPNKKHKSKLSSFGKPD